MNARRPVVTSAVRLILTVILTLLLAGVPSAYTQPARDTLAKGSGSPAIMDPSGSPQAIPVGWWAGAQDGIRQSEYHITWQEHVSLPDLPASSALLEAGAYQAPNRAHNLRTYFAPDGVRIIRRTSPLPTWVWGYRFEPAALPGDVQHVEPVLTAPNRIEYRYPGVTVWYENGKGGIAQGLVVDRPPPGALPLVLVGTLIGDLEPRHGETGIDFLHAGLPVVRYENLTAADAHGRGLSSRLALVDGEFRVVVESQGATYPIVVRARISSPHTGESVGDEVAGLFPAPDWMVESDQASAWFGFSVSTAGDVNGDGYADVIVGAPRYDSGQSNEGAAFVYHGSQTGLSMSPDWMVVGAQTDARLGGAVGTSGDVNGDNYADVIIGAVYYDNGQTDEGRAFVYHGSGTGLSAMPDWIAESDSSSAYFGRSVGTAGDVDGNGYDDVVVGASGYDGGLANQGRVYFYHGSAAGLSDTPDWIAEGNQEQAHLGRAVGTAGDVNGDGYSDVIVGAWGYDSGQTDEGRAYVYHGALVGLSTAPDWMIEGDQDGAKLGYSVGTAGDVNGDGYTDVIVGAYQYDQDDADEGSASVYYGSATGLSATADWTANGDQANLWFGHAVGTAGDVDGDGYHDVIVGAPYSHDDQAGGGWVAAYQGSPIGLSPVPNWLAYNDQIGARFGFSLGTAGDVNGDGFPEVIVGSHWYDGSEEDEGAASVYLVEIPVSGLEAVNDSPTPLGSATTLTATITTGSHLTYTWTFAEEEFGSGAVVTHAYPTAGVYTAIVTASNSISELTATTTITVDKIITGLAALNDSPTPLGSATTLTATIAAGTNVTYTWAFGDGEMDGGSVMSHTYPAMDFYTAVVTASNSVSLLTATTTVTITELGIFLPLVKSQSP